MTYIENAASVPANAIDLWEMIANITDTIEDEPENWYARLERAELYYEAGRDDLAKDDLDFIMDNNEEGTEIYNLAEDLFDIANQRQADRGR